MNLPGPGDQYTLNSCLNILLKLGSWQGKNLARNPAFFALYAVKRKHLQIALCHIFENIAFLFFKIKTIMETELPTLKISFFLRVSGASIAVYFRWDSPQSVTDSRRMKRKNGNFRWIRLNLASIASQYIPRVAQCSGVYQARIVTPEVQAAHGWISAVCRLRNAIHCLSGRGSCRAASRKCLAGSWRDKRRRCRGKNRRKKTPLKNACEVKSQRPRSDDRVFFFFFVHALVSISPNRKECWI